ncbi:MAG: type I glutamate--ammonia ligase [Dehalococcoidia bacterium]|nr:type I glutamate--ammonia ligase [Dehalococcoidia bacterium]MSQ17131.1 type I glutamate--ammonia ligase [Dehalococcoidia bacterium]
MTPSQAIQFCKEKGIGIIDLKFTDMPGTWQHLSIPLSEWTEENISDGYGFDGSSIRGFKPIQESDMLLMPDASTAVVDPFCRIPTLSVICNIMEPTREYFTRDPRFIAQKAEAFLAQSGLADLSYWGPELEHFIFDSARFDQTANSAFYHIDSDEGIWNTGAERTLSGGPNLANRPRLKEGYFPVSPMDSLQDIRSECVQRMEHFGIIVEKHHHEVATAGQNEIDMRFDTLTKMADQVMIQKYCVKNVAKAHGKVATFMPKPLFGDNGSGMHTHQSLWKNGKPLFYDANGYALFSDMGRHYIGGLLAHTPALLALIAPTTNSYRRLVPGYEAPVNLVYSTRNRSACIRIPEYFKSPASRRLEYRIPDPSCNPYLAFSAMLMAGLDGIINEVEPPEPVDVNLYELSPQEAAKIKQVPGSLQEVLEALERDHEFLLRGGVFTQDLIDTWLEYKRTRELDPVRLRPVPYEFFLYFDA